MVALSLLDMVIPAFELMVMSPVEANTCTFSNQSWVFEIPLPVLLMLMLPPPVAFTIIRLGTPAPAVAKRTAAELAALFPVIEMAVPLALDEASVVTPLKEIPLD